MAEQLIGNYRVLEQIGAGGMAKVYLAVHQDIPNLRVILKILSDPRLVQRFKQEADKLALLDGNPNICRIKHFFTHGDDVVIAMEYIEGQTLEDKLESEGRMTIVESSRIICEVLDIIQFAHDRGIYHRDIKPSNIMIDRTGTVKIIDFGIAKGESDVSLTIAGTACGTPAFMAPEQFTPSEDTNYALVDVYACGVTLYRMTTGELPFKGDNEFAIRDAKLFTDPANPKSLASEIPNSLGTGILKSIAKDPGRRYQSAGEMRNALKGLDVGAPSVADEATEDFRTGKVKQSPRRSLPLVGGVLAGIVVVLTLIWFFWLGGEPGGPEPVSLLTPTGGELLAVPPTLTWTEAPMDNASYILEYGSDSAFTDSRTLAGLTTANFTFSSELANGPYFWRVYTVGSDGKRSDASDSRSFAIDKVPRLGQLTINVHPRGDIYVDDVRQVSGGSRFESEVESGLHVIRIENGASRERAIRDTIDVAPDGSITRDYSFSFAPRSEPVAATGEVRIGSKPGGASVYIDGELQSGTTPYTYPLPAGRHVVRVTLMIEGSQVSRADTVRVIAGETATMIFNLE